MDFLTTRHLVMLALIQISAVTAGVLAAGASFKWCITFDFSPPTYVVWTCDYGWLVLSIPLLWITIAMFVRQRATAIVIGGLLLVGLVVGAWYVGMRPWLLVWMSQC